MNQNNYIQAGAAAICLLTTMIISLLLLIIYRTANNIYRRQMRLRVLVSYLNYTMMKQNFPLSILQPMLVRVNYDYEKLEKDRNEFMKWCMDPKGAVYQQPDDIFTEAAPNDPQYDTMRDMEKTGFWKAVGSGGTLSGQASVKQPTQPSQMVTVPESLRTSQPINNDKDDGLYEDPTKESSGTKKSKSSGSVKTSYTQEDDDGLYENPTGSRTAADADSTMRSKTGRTAIGGWEKSGGGSTSKSTESSGGSKRPSARTAYNTGDGDYENLENLEGLNKFN